VSMSSNDNLAPAWMRHALKLGLLMMVGFNVMNQV
jgi:hypothetical protein